MTTRSLYLAFAAAGAMLFAGLSVPSHAAPGPVLKPPAEVTLVQEVGYYNRRWRRNGTYVRAPLTEVDDARGETYVRAPFARVYSGRGGTWVRAPFVNLWVPR
jgi:hypothetical protein